MMGAGIQHTNQPVRGDPMPGSAVMMSRRGIVSRTVGALCSTETGVSNTGTSTALALGQAVQAAHGRGRLLPSSTGLPAA